MARTVKLVLIVCVLFVVMSGVVLAAVFEEDFSDPAASEKRWVPVLESADVVFNKGSVLIKERQQANRIKIDQLFKNPIVEVEMRFPRQSLNTGNHAGISLLPKAGEGAEKWIFLRRYHRFFAYNDFVNQPPEEVWLFKDVDFMRQEWHTIKVVVKDGTLTLYLNGQEAGTFEVETNEYYVSIYSYLIDAEFRKVRIEEQL
jgi:hypothetical protein